MIIKEKEKDINHFNSAKKYFNSNPSDYTNSLKELNQISFLKQNLAVIHSKVLCQLMLSKYEDIIECYYINKKFFDAIFDNSDNEEKNEIKKIISLGFFNFNCKKKAKIICPDIKDEFDYKIEKSEYEILKEKEDDSYGKIETGRVNKKKTFTNIKHKLDKNMKIIEQKKSEELMAIASDFVDDLFKTSKSSNSIKKFGKEVKNNDKLEKIEEKQSSGSDIYLKLKNEISDIKDIQKEDGNLITFEEQIKGISNNEKKSENEINNINLINKLINEDLVNNKPRESPKENIKIFNTNDNIDENNEINIYSNTNSIINNTNKEKNKKNKIVSKEISKDLPRKSCNVFSFVNPIEFTLSPGDASFNNYSNIEENGEIDENMANNNQNKNLVKVEVDDVQYFFVKKEKNNEINNNCDEYINIDFGEFRNKNKKKTTKIKYSKSLQINLDRNKYKNLEDFSKFEKEGKNVNDMRQSNWKKTSIYKTNFNLDNK